jgi:PAS domain-containing protein
VHQIELEMQNMELVESEERSRKATEKYTSLYDFAPMGYFTLDQDCRIKNVNLSGALLVGTERYLLQNMTSEYLYHLNTRTLLMISLRIYQDLKPRRSAS